jgi:3-oxoacyl-[acyl-carrier protein] reductase
LEKEIVCNNTLATDCFLCAMHSTDLHGKNALIGGGTQGIGKAIAIELAKMGANCILMARNEALLKTTIAELPNNQNQKHQYIAIDYQYPNQLKIKVENLVRSNPIHILINNTGGPPGGLIANAEVEDFLSAFNNHLVCNHVLVQATLPAMKKSGWGRIINVISTSVKQPLKGLGVSNTVRAAVANWSKTLATEVASFGITVNNVLPGATNTQRLQQIIESKSINSGESINQIKNEMEAEIPMGRFADPNEIAAAVAFLASTSAGYITGVNLPVDGGRTGCL